MLWFNHPRPFSRKEVAMHMASAKLARLPSMHSRTADAPGGPPAVAPFDVTGDCAEGPPIEFLVTYRLSEYLAFLQAHVQQVAKTAPALVNRRAHVGAGLAAASVLAALACFGMVLHWPWLAGLSAAAAMLGLAYAVSHCAIGLRAFTGLAGTLLFAVKRYRMPLCQFYLDQHRIGRVTARGELTLGWDKVVKVLAYRPGYMLMTGKGALLIPSRCLNAQQATQLRSIVARHRSSLDTGCAAP